VYLLQKHTVLEVPERLQTLVVLGHGLTLQGLPLLALRPLDRQHRGRFVRETLADQNDVLELELSP
jgi:hypothetical protein